MTLPVVHAAAGNYRTRIGAEEPAININLVRPKIDYRAAAQALVPTPVPKLLHCLEPVLLKCRRVHLSLLGPAKVFTRSFAAVPLTVNGCNSTQQFRLGDKLIVAVFIPRIAPALMTDLKQLARLLCGLSYLLRPFQRVRHLLLAIHVQTGLHTSHRMWRVPEIGRRNYHRIKVLFRSEHLLVVHVLVMLMLIGPQYARDALLVVSRPDIANRLETNTGKLAFDNGVHQFLALGAAT